jgi:hypothetical protein
LDGLRQEKFNLNLLTDWIYLFLKSARGISQSTVASIAHLAAQVKPDFAGARHRTAFLWRQTALCPNASSQRQNRTPA